jgi:hypothetical protein
VNKSIFYPCIPRLVELILNTAQWAMSSYNPSFQKDGMKLFNWIAVELGKIESIFGLVIFK